MITIAKTVEDIVSRSFVLEEALADDIVNLSALARKIKPAVEEQQMEEVTEGAIVMALKRYAEELTIKRKNIPCIHAIKGITVRSKLAEYAFAISPHFNVIHKKLLQLAEKQPDAVLHFAQGVFEVTIILSESLAPALEEMTASEKRLAKFTGLSSISIRLPQETAYTPGVYYHFFRALAWEGINFTEIGSVFSELTYFFEDKDVDRAFTAIKRVDLLQGK